jgi:hypothetical protein
MRFSFSIPFSSFWYPITIVVLGQAIAKDSLGNFTPE